MASVLVNALTTRITMLLRRATVTSIELLLNLSAPWTTTNSTVRPITAANVGWEISRQSTVGLCWAIYGYSGRDKCDTITSKTSYLVIYSLSAYQARIRKHRCLRAGYTLTVPER